MNQQDKGRVTLLIETLKLFISDATELQKRATFCIREINKIGREEKEEPSDKDADYGSGSGR